MTAPDASDAPYVPVRIAPDPARDARVAARRAEDARKAGLALDRLMADLMADTEMKVAGLYDRGWGDGYRAAALQHNRNYGVAPCALAGDGEHDCADSTSEGTCRR